MNCLFHGSFFPNIEILKPVSISHKSLTENIIYLTSNRAYALFYIWDSEHNRRKNKWASCAVKNGIVNYYEQFPNQLKSFYHGVCGYLYSVLRNDNFEKGSEEDMWLSKNEVQVTGCEKINDVYDEVLKCEASGNVKIIYYEALPTEEQNRMVDMMVGYIRKKGLLLTPQSEEAIFVSPYYNQAWEKASLVK